MPTAQAAHLEMNAAYPEFKKVRCDLQVLLTAGSYRTRGRVAKLTKMRSVHAGYPEVESYTMAPGFREPTDRSRRWRFLKIDHLQFQDGLTFSEPIAPNFDVLNVLNDTAEEELTTDNLFSPNFRRPNSFTDPRRAMVGSG